MKTKKIILWMFVAITVSHVNAQNIISVPFNSGFVGDNTANNVSSNSVYLSSLGWSNIQFAQSTSGTTFTAQGNDIIGMIYITDANGVEHTINGFVKWRAPSGTVSALVFSPSSTAVLATNGSNGSSTYTISSAKYVGLIFNGMTLTIPTSGNNAGQVSGNAATSGLLTTLNDYLGTLPSISITDATINESAGTVTVTLSLSTSSSNQVTLNYITSNGTATSTNDYTSVSGSMVFLAGQTTKPLTITITTDNISEFQESFFVNLSDAVNASIIKNASTIVIEDGTLPVELTSFSVSCEKEHPIVNWQTASEHNSAMYNLEKSIDGDIWELVTEIVAAGNSNTTINYQFEDIDAARFVGYYQLTQVDIDGKQNIYGPIYSNCLLNGIEMEIQPNPTQGEFLVKFNSQFTEKQSITIISGTGITVYSEMVDVQNGSNQILLNTNGWNIGFYLVQIKGMNTQTIKKLIVQ